VSPVIFAEVFVFFIEIHRLAPTFPGLFSRRRCVTMASRDKPILEEEVG
jgi:hypothetical protein